MSSLPREEQTNPLEWTQWKDWYKRLRDREGGTNLSIVYGRDNFDSSAVLSLARVLKEPDCRVQSLSMRNSSYLMVTCATVTRLAKALQTNTSVFHLDLAETEVRTAGCQALAELMAVNRTIGTLSVSSLALEDEGIASLLDGIQQNTTLHTLHIRKAYALPSRRLSSRLAYQTAGPALARLLGANSTALKTLYVTGATWDEATAELLRDALRGNTSLQCLDLDNFGIPVVGFRFIMEGIKWNKALASLRLSCDLTMDALQRRMGFLADVLRENETIEDIGVTSSSMGCGAAVALAGGLAHNLVLRSLTLEKNQIGEKGAEALAGALIENNHCLRRLDMSRNPFCDLGAVALANALPMHTTLETLDLSGPWRFAREGNDVRRGYSARAIQSLADALRTSRLQSLKLSHVMMDDEQAALLASVLEHNSYLRLLNLSSNQFEDLGAAAIFNAVAANTTLEALLMSGIEFRTSGVAALRASVIANSTLKNLQVVLYYAEDEDYVSLVDAVKTNESLLSFGFEDQRLAVVTKPYCTRNLVLLAAHAMTVDSTHKLPLSLIPLILERLQKASTQCAHTKFIISAHFLFRVLRHQSFVSSLWMNLRDCLSTLDDDDGERNTGAGWMDRKRKAIA